jgi:hypothetical protein
MLSVPAMYVQCSSLVDVYEIGGLRNINGAEYAKDERVRAPTGNTLGRV